MKKIYAITSALLLISGAMSHAADSYPLKTCVVSGDLFGGDLGPPIKIDYNGRQVILCCKSCIKKFERDPQKYMAILDAAQTGKK